MSTSATQTTPKERWIQAANAVQDNCDFLGYLWARWQDERGLEDFSGYERAIAERFRGFFLCNFKRRPFEFVILIDAATSLEMVVRVSGREITWKRCTQ